MAEKPTYEQLEKKLRDLEAKTAVLEKTVKSLRESEERFRTIYANAPVMIDAFDETGRGVLWNKECEKMLGWSEEEILSSQDPLSLLYPEHDLRDLVLSDKMHADGIFREYIVAGKDSSKHIQLWANFRLPTGAIISVGHDITELKTAEEALKKNEQHFRDLVESSPTGISIVREDKVLYRNQEQQRIFGPLPETYRPLISDIIHPEDMEKLQKMYKEVISGKILNSGMDIRFFPSGREKDDHNMKWLHCRASLIEYQGEKAVLLNMMDITKAREMDRLLTIQDRMTSLGHVAAGIAHEIRNPLSGINIYLNTLEKIFLRGTDFDNVQRIITQIQSASNKIESVIKRVMDFSKPSEPKFVLSDINKPIYDAIGLSSVTLRKTGISIESSLSPGLPPYYADPQLIEQVLLNLITNASEAMKDLDEKKKIEIRSYIKNQNIVITVSDSGPGISSSQKQKIFDPFYTTKPGSTGIGLNLSHRIISDHGGMLNVSESSLGGAKFTIELPLENTAGEKR